MRPNIIYLNSHDTGRYVRPYGYPVATPRLQQLAEEGVVFRRAFSASPTCSPSRAALLTGRYPHEVGMLGLSHRGFSLIDHHQHLSHVLRTAGYRTVLAGLQHVADDPTKLGYDEILPVPSHSAGDVAPAAADFLASAHEQPFYLEVGFFETHRPYPTPEPVDDPRYLQPPAPVPDSIETREDMARYSSSVRRLDDGVGQVLDALERAGIADNTLVICTTDHGLAFPNMKCTLSDDGIGVMLMMRGPGGFTGGSVSDALVSQLDLFPTVCELAGISPSEGLRGRSLLTLMDGSEGHLHDAVYAELNYHVDYQPQRCVRTDRYKYIRSFRQLDHRILEHTDEGASKQYLAARGWGGQGQAPEMMFDLLLDPHEANNLVSDCEHSDTVKGMRARLESWMRVTDDPVLRGPVPAPPGANVKGAP
ncbi:sulfatase [Brachybacterium sp. P6-10-X1]|uniref:sulfatase family protein n=1 Tax=Brachybacterium sp. P6-10-X1 TaxID=1903186 RepID=UPI00097176FE|nr:sulfatase [Brachybacterium sp. P6-10-X1]APX31783.1 sulfatase [Brachybacterium sp. P6-10-X1]